MDRFVELYGKAREPFTSSSSSARQHPTDQSLAAQHKILTEQIIQLKFDIATQRGNQDEYHLDWQRLLSEKEALREEIVQTEEEYKKIVEEVRRTHQEVGEISQKSNVLQSEVSLEQEKTERLQIEYDSLQHELTVLRREMADAISSEEAVRKTMADLQVEADQISSEAGKIDGNEREMMLEIDTIKKEIAAIQQDLLDREKNTKEKLGEDLIRIRRKNSNLLKMNDRIESKISRNSFW